MPHWPDARQLGRVDPVAFDPGPDREQVRVADRVLLAGSSESLLGRSIKPALGPPISLA
jgi:hypothetical protein